MTPTSLKITFLGTGTSQGVPVIGCDCQVCSSKDKKDKRLRTSVLVSIGSTNIAIDAGPDFRQQMLAAGIKKLSAILITHQHNDHIIGLDEVRPFNFRIRKPMLVYGTSIVLKEVQNRFGYIFAENPYPGAPQIELMPIANEAFEVDGISIQPIEAMHGNMPVTGFRIGDFTYLTDIKEINPGEMAKAQNSKVLVLSALHHKEHHAHLNLKQALELIELLKPETAYLTHMSHRMGLHEEVTKELPEHVHLAYDGLEILISRE